MQKWKLRHEIRDENLTEDTRKGQISPNKFNGIMLCLENVDVIDWSVILAGSAPGPFFADSNFFGEACRINLIDQVYHCQFEPKKNISAEEAWEAR